MKIPHDYYLKFMDDVVYSDTLGFHCKGNFTIHEVTKHYSALHHIPSSELRKLTGNELELNVTYGADHLEPELTIPTLAPSHCLLRNDSCNDFKQNPVSLSQLKKLLAPLVRKQDSSDKRGYPSGGALYPIEVFCCNMNADHAWPDGASVYHLLGRSQKLERHPKINSCEKMQTAFLPESSIGNPSVALVYCIYLPKALFKYRSRGYRLALMEAGSMYMLVDLRCKELSVDSRPWSAFTDYQVASALNLNPALFLPVCIQLIG